jgi:excinuclease ABC subunit C
MTGSANQSSENSVEAVAGGAGDAVTKAGARRKAPVGSALEDGRQVINDHLKTLPGRPGVYRMIGADGTVLYVGKAKSLKKRVSSYTKFKGKSIRALNLIAQTTDMEFITTHTEVEALLLEANLIKQHKPPFNVLLRDDKSFPYIIITGEHLWPQIAKHRGARNLPGEYFGPFASALAVNNTINTLQRAFPLRNCSDSVFASRTRPCLQYQIKRCTAPCVGRISEADYAADVAQARDFLKGRSSRIQQALSKRMHEAAERQEYEAAAVFRDRIRALSQIQSRQDINLLKLGQADVIAGHQEGGQTCIQVFFFRSGQNYGNRAYFPANTRNLSVAEVLAAFLGQFYARRTAPRRILLSDAVEGQPLIEEALSLQAGHAVRIEVPGRGKKYKLVQHCIANANDALGRRLAESATQRRLLDGLAQVFGLEAAPARIEVYDNSHTGGSQAVGAMIVAGQEGLIKNQYRKFNIKDSALVPGDDYGMMREVLSRRFSRLLRENAEGDPPWPDLVLIDGGAGHLTAAQEVFADLGLDGVELAAIAKGRQRHAGREVLHQPGRPALTLEPRDPVLYFLQRLRDEAHRFAIGSHRAKRAQKLARSILDEVPGIGPRRKRALLNHFGSARAVAGAGLADLEQVEGISGTVASAIYDHFHGEG